MSIDFSAHEVTVDVPCGRAHASRVRIDRHLARSPGRRLAGTTPEERVEAAADWQTAATVTEHVRRLRAKIGKDPEHPCWS